MTEHHKEWTVRSAYTGEDESELLEVLRKGDEAAFARLVTRYSGSLLRIALAYVPNHAAAEEVVQETWLAVLEGIQRFEGRSSFKTWLFKILVNRAKTRGERERRYVEFSSIAGESADSEEPMVDPAQFDHAGRWITQPRSWDEVTPERLLLSKESRALIDQAIASLPAVQRQVITLRDIEGCSSQEVCNILNVSETNQRVLLHRARTKVRRAIESQLGSSLIDG
ncbi:MAG: sigma-70 family RNA polymerase sigma factor [Nitrospirae bacterium]|nr:MAG: sigma-70 family RNA polymerase sigma factor [Nitrospirota bacterium]